MGDQATVQQVLTASIASQHSLTMIATCVHCILQSQINSILPALTEPPTFAPLPFVQWSGFGLIFCTTAVALDVHWNIPDVLQPMRDKRPALRIALGALLTAALFYSLIACGVRAGVRSGRRCHWSLSTGPTTPVDWVAGFLHTPPTPTRHTHQAVHHTLPRLQSVLRLPTRRTHTGRQLLSSCYHAHYHSGR